MCVVRVCVTEACVANRRSGRFSDPAICHITFLALPFFVYMIIGDIKSLLVTFCKKNPDDFIAFKTKFHSTNCTQSNCLVWYVCTFAKMRR